MSDNDLVVEAHDLSRDYDFGEERVHALRGVSFDIRGGDYVAIVGPSGCGKSTLLNLLGAIDKPTRGSVRIAGNSAGEMGDRDATRF
ncbi:MAG TPA: ATP-binding cassette domain-containing protein, partial [Gemmatimonadaceae bacterium]|nr:ATP-binding cassette domain-containing protein [Gemmatimonadaceae bacterium]